MGNDQDKRISPIEFYKLSVKTISSLTDEVINSFLADFPDGEVLTIRVLQPAILPIVNSINSVGVASEQTLELVDAIKNNCNFQAWRQPYSIVDFGEEFFSQSAWFPIADLQGPLVYSGGLMEIMFLNSQLTYPKHKHSPEELYIVLAGKVWWEADDSDESPAWKHAGEVIHHRSNQAHAITAGDNPVLILSLWRGGSFEKPSIL